jgi:hypothetical protein
MAKRSPAFFENPEARRPGEILIWRIVGSYGAAGKRSRVRSHEVRAAEMLAGIVLLFRRNGDRAVGNIIDRQTPRTIARHTHCNPVK